MSLRRRPRAALLAFMAAAPAFAMAPGDGERLPPTWVNGVRLDITRWTDRDLARRVQGLEAEWRRTSGEVQAWRDVGGWRLLSRRDGRWSETLQVRKSGATSELYLSRMDLTQRPRSLPQLHTPPGCRANSVVETVELGGTVAQASGPCRGESLAQASSWATQMKAAGWEGGQVRGKRLWQFQRGAELLQVIRAPDWFTSLQTPAKGGLP